MVGSYLTVSGSTLLFRKFIGLEMAGMIQFGYLSLLQNKEVTIYQQPML